MKGFDASCHGKVRHPTKGEALDHKAQMGRSSGYDREVTVYHCSHCKGYHVGRARKGDPIPTKVSKRRALRVKEPEKEDEEC